MPLPPLFIARAVETLTSAGFQVWANNQCYSGIGQPVAPVHNYRLSITEGHDSPHITNTEIHLLLESYLPNEHTPVLLRKTFSLSRELIVLEETMPVVIACQEFIRDIQQHLMPLDTGNRQFRERVAAQAQVQRSEAQLARTRQAAEHGVERAQRMVEEAEILQRDYEQRLATERYLNESRPAESVEDFNARISPGLGAGSFTINLRGEAYVGGIDGIAYHDRPLPYQYIEEPVPLTPEQAYGTATGRRISTIIHEEAGAFPQQGLMDRLSELYDQQITQPARQYTAWTGAAGIREFEAAIERTVEAAAITHEPLGRLQQDGEEVHYVRHQPLQLTKSWKSFFKKQEDEEKWAPEPDVPDYDLGF